jgi:drug/metabolite transporter (DMT)-like permease
MHSQHRGNLRAIALMLAAVGLFAFMDASLKHLAQDYPPLELVVVRCLASLPFLLCYTAWRGSWSVLRPRNVPLHLVRGVLAFTMLVCFIYAVARLSLADTYAIFLCAPLLMTALSVPLLGERVTVARWCAIAVGLAGVLVMLRPTGSGLGTLGGLAAAIAALCYALSGITIRVLGRTDSTGATVLSFLLLAGLGALGLALPDWRPLARADFVWIGCVGVTGAVAQQLITEAFRRAPPAVVGPFEYTAMLWAFGLDWLLWQHLPTAIVLVGSAIVAASGLYMIWDERQSMAPAVLPANPQP